MPRIRALYRLTSRALCRVPTRRILPYTTSAYEIKYMHRERRGEDENEVRCRAAFAEGQPHVVGRAAAAAQHGPRFRHAHARRNFDFIVLERRRAVAEACSSLGLVGQRLIIFSTMDHADCISSTHCAWFQSKRESGFSRFQTFWR